MYKYAVTWIEDEKQNIRKFEKKEDAIKQGMHLAINHYAVEIFERIGVIETTPHFVPDEPQEDDDGWIEWNGGECPVGGRVEYKLKDGYKGFAHACRLRWDQSGDGTDIIAYRIAK